MILISKTIKNNFDNSLNHSCEVYYNEKSNMWTKIVKGVDFDIDSFLKFNEIYNIVVEPLMIEYQNNILEYVMEDVSDNIFKFNNQTEVYNCFQNIIHFFKCYSEFSKNTKKVFYHADMKKDNMVYIDGCVKLIDIDSFIWNTKEKFIQYSLKCMQKAWGFSWDEISINSHYPGSYRNDWYKMMEQ